MECTVYHCKQTHTRTETEVIHKSRAEVKGQQCSGQYFTERQQTSCGREWTPSISRSLALTPFNQTTSTITHRLGHGGECIVWREVNSSLLVAAARPAAR